MNPVITVQSSAITHHINVSKIASVRHEPRANRAQIFFSGGSELIVMFGDHAALAKFVAQYKAVAASLH